MFYPTVEDVIGVSYQVNEPYFRFMLLADELKDVAEKDRLARKAFDHILATHDACKYNKMLLLSKILEKCPEAIDGITDDSMVESLKELSENMLRRGELISTPELEWVGKYVRTKSAQQEAEKIIFCSMLLGNSGWDKTRHAYKWTISKSVRHGLIRETLQSDNLGSKRKIELAKEIGEPTEDIERRYFRKLLWDRHYDNAAKITARKDEDVLLVVQQNLDAGYFTDALNILTQFLPDRKELAAEIERIIAVFEK
jgi:hypothetical protein